MSFAGQSPASFGPPVWDMNHAVGLLLDQYLPDLDEEMRQCAVAFFQKLFMVLPCRGCRIGADAVLAEMSRRATLLSERQAVAQRRAVAYTVQLHCLVTAKVAAQRAPRRAQDPARWDIDTCLQRDWALDVRRRLATAAARREACLRGLTRVLLHFDVMRAMGDSHLPLISAYMRDALWLLSVLLTRDDPDLGGGALSRAALRRAGSSADFLNALLAVAVEGRSREELRGVVLDEAGLAIAELRGRPRTAARRDTAEAYSRARASVARGARVGGVFVRLPHEREQR